MSSLFWKVFLTIWLASITEVILASIMVNWDVRQRVSQFEVSERFTELAGFIIERYESGLDTRVPESAETLSPEEAARAGIELPVDPQPEGRGVAPGRQIMVIDDLLTGEKIFGTRFPEDRDSWVQWETQSEYGGLYLVSVLNPTNIEFNLVSFFTPFRVAVTLLVTALFSWFFTLILTRPLRGLRSHVEELGSGHLDHSMEQGLLNRGDELGDLARSIDSMAARIQTLLESRQRLLYDVSHELRAPLARLQMATELARDKADASGSGRALFDRLQSETEMLNRLITELLNLARNETDLGEIERVRLDELIYGQVEDVRFGHRERVINADLAAGREMVTLRPMLLARSIHNLLENAIKYSPADRPVDVSIHRAGDKWQILIEDRGPGIPEESLETVFRPFNRLNPDSAKGFGLGLSIARRSIQSLGGTIVLSNRNGGGLRVEILLPR